MTKRGNDITVETTIAPARAQNERFFFDFSPIALAEEDISELKEYIENMRNRGIENFRSYFEHHPEELVPCLKKIKLVDVNPAMVNLFEASSKEDLLEGGLKFEFDNYDSLKDFREGLIAYCEGKNTFESEGMLQTLTGKELFLISKWSFSPEPEDSGTRMVFSFVDITERKTIEDELRTFKTATDRSIVGNAIVDLDGTYRYVNEAYAHMHGYTREELEGKHASIAHSEEYSPTVERLNRELMSLGFMENIEVLQKRKDGSNFSILVNATVIKNDNGNPAFISFSMIDNSLRKEAEENLRKFKTISDTSSAGNAICDLNGTVIYGNEAIARMHGYTVDEIMGKHFSTFHTEEQFNMVNRLNEALKTHGSMENLEVGNLRKDGSTFSSLINATLIKDPEGNPLYVALSSVDISELKEKEEKLLLFKTITDRANVGNAITGSDGIILYVNDTLARMHGYEKEELIGEHASLFHADDQQRAASVRRRRALLKQESMGNVEIMNKRKDGSVLPALLNSTLIKGDGGEILFASSVVDISILKDAEALLRQREEELEINNLKLKEMNATLKVLLSNREDEKTDLEEKVLTNVKELAMPVLQKLKKCGMGGRAEAYVEVLETSLNEIISPFMRTLASKYMGLTQAELEVASLVKEGKNIKEIGRLMNLSGRSVETYRTRIRKKLGIGGKKVNLRTYLLSFK